MHKRVRPSLNLTLVWVEFRFCSKTQIGSNFKTPLCIQTYTLSHPENDRDVTDRIASKNTHRKPHLGVPFWTRDKTHKFRERLQESSSGIRADITVVLEMRQSIVTVWTYLFFFRSRWFSQSPHDNSLYHRTNWRRFNTALYHGEMKWWTNKPPGVSSKFKYVQL